VAYHRWRSADLHALGLSEVDLLGFSIGSFIAQEIALTAEPVKTRLEAAFTEFLGQILLHVKEWK